MNRTRRQWPFFFQRRDGIGEKIGNRNAIDRFCRVASEPAQHVSLVSALSQNVPYRFDLARSAGGRPHSAGLRVRLHEAEDSMLVRPLPGGDGVPEHWR